mmetsp:Transcript_10466/g.15122  ORF Transcript_10466/g.15122 Transcript_10466/m.15122 type:complete len:140 (-) Transcript_10466:75-494(-)
MQSADSVLNTINNDAQICRRTCSGCHRSLPLFFFIRKPVGRAKLRIHRTCNRCSTCSVWGGKKQPRLSLNRTLSTSNLPMPPPGPPLSENCQHCHLANAGFGSTSESVFSLTLLCRTCQLNQDGDYSPEEIVHLGGGPV